jgi:hypothetical protein
MMSENQTEDIFLRLWDTAGTNQQNFGRGVAFGVCSSWLWRLTWNFELGCFEYEMVGAEVELLAGLRVLCIWDGSVVLLLSSLPVCGNEERMGQ